MTFDVKNGRYKQETIRVNGKVVSIYRGKTRRSEKTLRPTKLDKVAGDRIDELNAKIVVLYDGGYGDRAIAKILYDEDGIENPPGSLGESGAPLGHSVIQTQRMRLGITSRVQKKKEPEKDWKAIAAEQKQSIDELNRSLQSAMDERDRYIQRHEECMRENYAMKYPGV